MQKIEKVAIFGAGKLGKVALSWCKTFGVQVECFVDNNWQKIVGNPIPVISMQEFCNTYKGKLDSVLFAIENRFGEFGIAIDLIKNGFNVHLVSSSFGIKELDPEYPPIPFLETHVSKHCNLKCKGCQHFSNIEPEQQFPSLSQFSKDLKRLSELFCEIETFNFLGGEPLLNPEINLWFSTVKSIFPNANLSMVTNGLPILNLDSDILSSIKENKVCVEISQYPPTSKAKDKIEDILAKNSIRYIFSEPIEKFRKPLSKHGKNNTKKALELCECKHSHFLENGNLGKCPTLMNIDRYFNKDFANNFYSTEGDIIDIYNTQLSPLQILEKLYKPAHLCSYCSESGEWQNWQAGKAELKDWVVSIAK